MKCSKLINISLNENKLLSETDVEALKYRD